MKRVTASEARRNWFRLLDEIVDGEVVVIERNGAHVVLRREEPGGRKGDRSVPDYGKAISVPNADEADRWGWEWDADGLRPREDPYR